MSPEALQEALESYLTKIDWTGDRERLAQRLAHAHSRGAHVVGIRRRGQEVLLHESEALTVHELEPSGRFYRVGTIWRDGDLERWLEHHRYYLEWVNPAYRRLERRADGERPSTSASR